MANIFEFKMENSDQSDIFLTSVKTIFGLEDDFLKVEKDLSKKITEDQKAELKRLCDGDWNRRIEINKRGAPHFTTNIDWSYEVVKKYLNVDIEKPVVEDTV